MTAHFSPGDLVRARGREWVALPSPKEGWLALRPLSGGEADIQLLHPALELEEPRPATFDLPTTDIVATQDGARLLSDALRMSLRRGAGPFRSAARLAFEPRAYQLVPLLMALRMPAIRLLIADDVGIGKTIEAGLIARELIDRGEADRMSVLCPPHLVEQWVEELKAKFDIDAEAVTSSSAARLERGLLASQTLFDAHPFTVVSLDYIKANSRRASFERACPNLVIVDEAHSCVGTHQGRQQRFDLLKELAKDQDRHMMFLTATPHSGDEDAFDRLLGLLDPSFSGASLQTQATREKVARYFVQRRRIDITGKDWGETRVFPKHETAEQTYPLSGPHRQFHEAVIDYCLHVVERAGETEGARRLAFWGTLAMMRCVGSSPAAALSALKNRLRGDADQLVDQILDEDDEDSDASDIEFSPGLETATPLGALVAQAEALQKEKDPKLETLVGRLKPMIKDGANVVVFCRFIATAHHVAERLRKEWPKLRIESVTGALTPDERRARVEDMAANEQRLLVATDCLSEGINLQSLFDSVIHYDLSWNPTRHQQREGRVNRFGQPAPLVRTIMMHSPDSAIDVAVVEVIQRKADRIREQTGIVVPLPEAKASIAGALMSELLRNRRSKTQLGFDFGAAIDVEAATRDVDRYWKDAEDGEKRSRTRFAQNAIRPAEVISEWQRWRDVLGTPEEVRRFVGRALSRFGSQLVNTRANTFKTAVSELPTALKERLAARGLEGTLHLGFEEPVASGATMVGRAHALTGTLAEALFESALDPSSNAGASLGRAGSWLTAGVQEATTVVLLRLRFKLTVLGRQERMLLVEEAQALAFGPGSAEIIAEGEAARVLLEHEAAGNLAEMARDRVITHSLEALGGTWAPTLAAFAQARAATLEADHGRLRIAGAGVPRVTVEAVLPPDIIGVFVLVPAS